MVEQSPLNNVVAEVKVEPQVEFSPKDFFAALKQVAQQNLLSLDEIKTIIEQAVFKSFHTKFDPDAELTLIIDEQNEIFELTNQSKTVVADQDANAEYRAIEVPLSEAKKLNPKAAEGDLIAEVVDFHAYSKAIAQQIRQMITQSIKESRKEAVWERHKDLKGQVIEVTVMTVTNTYAIFALDDQTTAFMPSKLRNPKIALKVGERVKVNVEDVLKESKDAQIVVSNGSPLVVRQVLTFEVPEINDGNVEIVSLSRAPGERSKVAVRAKNPHVDPIGAVIGMQGTRINAIINKLGGERLDIVLWSPDINSFVANSLAPARVIAVIDKLDENRQPVPKFKIAITPNRHQTLAIGRGGTNVRLAVELTDTRIDVVSLEEAERTGLSYTWNGNINAEELRAVEAGERIGRSVRSSQPQRGNNQNGSSQIPRSVSASIFDDAISSFNEEIEFESAPAIQTDDAIFSEEELRKMEASFAFDDELAKYESDEAAGRTNKAISNEDE